MKNRKIEKNIFSVISMVLFAYDATKGREYCDKSKFSAKR